MIKCLKKLGIERSYLNIIKAINDKNINNKMKNWDKLKALPLKSGLRQMCLLSQL
jgi:hypothetical protein